jgi:hypothetical protein
MSNRFPANACFAFAASAVVSIAPVRADPQSTQALNGAYRGTIVCEKIKGAAGILRVPLDLVVRGGNVQFARPTFNLKGTRVTGSELGSGAIDADGKLHLTSAWVFGNIGLQGDYSGTLSASGGTFSGTQSWRGPDGMNGSRACNAALVPVPKLEHAASDQ